MKICTNCFAKIHEEPEGKMHSCVVSLPTPIQEEIATFHKVWDEVITCGYIQGTAERHGLNNALTELARKCFLAGQDSERERQKQEVPEAARAAFTCVHEFKRWIEDGVDDISVYCHKCGTTVEGAHIIPPVAYAVPSQPQVSEQNKEQNT